MSEAIIDGEVIDSVGMQALAPQSTAVDEPAKQPVVIYDADAEQRVMFRTPHKGRLYKVTHIFGALTDEGVGEYSRRLSQKITDASTDESDEQDATAVSTRGFEAAVHYWNSTSARAEGYAGPVPDRDKVYAVNQLFGVEFQQLPMARADELRPAEDDENSTYILRCLFDSHECYTSAVLRPATSSEIAEFESLMSRSLLVQGMRFGQREQRVPARSKRLGEFFDLMKVAVEGYKRRVPLHHKTAFALRHLRSEHELITGN